MILRHGPKVILALTVTGVVAWLALWWADPTR